MKHQLFNQLKYRLRSDQKFKKRLKFFVLFGFVGILLSSAFVVWAGVSVIRFAGQQIQSTQIHDQVGNFVDHKNSIPTTTTAITTENCWNKTLSLLNIEPWMTKPLGDNLNTLKKACIQSEPKS